MMNNDQVKKLKIFSSITTISNKCFRLCSNDFSLDNSSSENFSVITDRNRICLEDCALRFLETREFTKDQLFRDFDSIKVKNRKIYDVS
jgi:hypothetical protein